MTRELLAMIYNMNRAKGIAKEGKHFMRTSKESETEGSLIPTKEEQEAIAQKYGR